MELFFPTDTSLLKRRPRCVRCGGKASKVVKINKGAEQPVCDLCAAVYVQLWRAGGDEYATPTRFRLAVDPPPEVDAIQVLQHNEQFVTSFILSRSEGESVLIEPEGHAIYFVVGKRHPARARLTDWVVHDLPKGDLRVMRSADFLDYYEAVGVTERRPTPSRRRPPEPRQVKVRSKMSGKEGIAYVADPHVWVEGRGVAGWYRRETIDRDFIKESD